jgi:hypothetical protein
VILVFAGRRPGSDAFPQDKVNAVGEQTRRLVADLRPRLAIGSAAAGADLLAAEAALEAGARVEILLAGDKGRFRSESVEDKGPPWPERFDRLLSSAAVAMTEVPRLDDADASYRAVTIAVVERAEQLAEAGEATTLLALSSPREGALDHTEELVALAVTRRWQILHIDPAQPAGQER